LPAARQGCAKFCAAGNIIAGAYEYGRVSGCSTGKDYYRFENESIGRVKGMIVNNGDIDLEKMSCRNLTNRITVQFTDKGTYIDGKIDDVSLPLLSALAWTEGGETYLAQQLGEVERVFLPELIKARTG
jgi:hypothetical protein